MDLPELLDRCRVHGGGDSVAGRIVARAALFASKPLFPSDAGALAFACKTSDAGCASSAGTDSQLGVGGGSDLVRAEGPGAISAGAVRCPVVVAGSS
jgi:hypothetical protein